MPIRASAPSKKAGRSVLPVLGRGGGLLVGNGVTRDVLDGETASVGVAVGAVVGCIVGSTVGVAVTCGAEVGVGVVTVLVVVGEGEGGPEGSTNWLPDA